MAAKCKSELQSCYTGSIVTFSRGKMIVPKRENKYLTNVIRVVLETIQLQNISVSFIKEIKITM